jgi:hypothetical protein
MQSRVLFAIDNGAPLLTDYTRHQFSPEGQSLRAFAQRMRVETDPHELGKIPLFLERTRDSFLARLRRNDAPSPSPSRARKLSPADSLRHTSEGASALLNMLAGTASRPTVEQIDFAFECYFFDLVGPHVFEMFRERQADAVVSQKCSLFESVSAEQYGISGRLLQGGEVFRQPVEHLRQFGQAVTPTAKLITAYRAVETLLQEINDKTGTRAGVDDFTNPLQFCCLKANIESAISQIRFIASLTKRRLMGTAFWSHFVTLQLVLEHIAALDIDDEIQEAITSSASVGQLVSPFRGSGPPRSVFDGVTLVAESFERLPVGLLEVGDPFPVAGFKAFVVVSWKTRPNYPFSVLVVRTENEADVVMMRVALFSDGIAGVKLTAMLSHPPDLQLSPVVTNDGVVHATTIEALPNGFRAIPIQSGSFDEERGEIDLKCRFALVDGLCGSESVEQHIQAIREQYEIEGKEDVIRLLAKRAADCLKDLGLLVSGHEGKEIDWKVLAGLANFAHRVSEDEVVGCDRLTPRLLAGLEDYVKGWKKALTAAPFGYPAGTPSEFWRLTASLLQACCGLPLTEAMDEMTVKEAKKLIGSMLDQEGIRGGTRATLSNVLCWEWRELGDG